MTDEMLQGRLTVFARTLFFVDLAYVLAFHAAMAVDPNVGVAGIIASGSLVETVPEFLLWGSAWGVLAGLRMGTAALRAIDALIPILAGVLYGAWVVLYPLGGLGVYEMILSCMAVFLFRAFTIPSSPRRTAILTAFGCLPGLLAVVFVPDPGGLPVAHGTLIAVTGTWLAVVVIFATAAAAVIHHLRREVRDARKLGQYTLLEKLGEGGMGEVYSARHALLRRPTALKLLRSERASPQSISRFEREVQLTSELTHPNVVAVFDFGRTDDGAFYYVMEHLDGLDLDRLVTRTGPMSPARARHVLAQIAGALEDAHAHGLIHRDVKPANVILCPHRGGHDVAKVCDFGLVKEIGMGDGPTETMARQLVGTPLYISPEAVAGRPLDPRSDLYSLGVLAYELLTGTPPFTGDTVVEVCARHLDDEPEPLAMRLGRAVPEDLEAVVMHCLEKSPDNRPASARVVVDALPRVRDVPVWTAAHAADWWEEHEGVLAKTSSSTAATPHQTLQVATGSEGSATATDG